MSLPSLMQVALEPKGQGLGHKSAFGMSIVIWSAPWLKDPVPKDRLHNISYMLRA